MKQPTPQQREALARINSSHDGQLMLEWLRSWAADANHQLRTARDVHDMKNAQGEAQALHVVVEAITDSRRILSTRAERPKIAGVSAP